MKKFSLSVNEFAQPAPLHGSIDTYSGFSRGRLVGSELHKEIQEQRHAENANYEAEVMCFYSFKSGQYTFEVMGKIDGFIRIDHFIEEIKSGFDLNKLHKTIEEQPEHPYRLQLLTYGYIWLQRKNIVPTLNLHLVSSRNKKFIDFPIVLEVDKYEKWLTRRLQALCDEVDFILKRSKHRKKIAKSVTFPFAKPRQGQIELIESIEAGMQKKNPMLMQAPTGIGKTIGVIYPTLNDLKNFWDSTLGPYISS